MGRKDSQRALVWMCMRWSFQVHLDDLLNSGSCQLFGRVFNRLCLYSAPFHLHLFLSRCHAFPRCLQIPCLTKGRGRKNTTTTTYSLLSHKRKELVVKPNTFCKSIRLGEEKVNGLWMLIDELHTLKLAERRIREDGCQRKSEIRMSL